MIVESVYETVTEPSNFKKILLEFFLWCYNYCNFVINNCVVIVEINKIKLSFIHFLLNTYH